MRFATGAAALSLWFRHATAIHVAKGSPCQTLCGNVLDATTKDDVVCKESDYSVSAAGSVYQQTACEPFQDAIKYNDLASNGTEFDYCDNWDHNQLAGCTACLRAGDNHYLTNFMTILDAGCQQKPDPGQTVSVEGSPFSKTSVNATDPTPTNTYVPNYNSGPISLGGKVGIAIGGVVVILALTGFCIVWNGKRRRRAFLKKMEMKQKGPANGWPSPLNVAGLNGTPLSQRPLRSWENDTPNSSRPTHGWDESPLSPQGEKAFPRYFSPYSSQYNSPVSGTEAPNMQWPTNGPDPQHQQQEIGLALGGDDAQQDWDDSHKGKGRSESYELREVDHQWDARQRHPSPPVLQHPAHPMYAEHNPAAYHGMTEDDLRRGYI
ncbi:hypothetical protein COL154_000319 [Colletotrichum chrysophilum]|nr:hypothetical protein COL154_000319 [Colletotrichum chrysophilum]